MFAYFSNLRDKTKTYVPVVKVPRADLELRPELKYVFNQVGLDYQQLVCLEQVPSQGDVVLIDHNRATRPFDDNCKWKVIGILDHHVDEGFYLNAPLRVIRMVGSCVSLVLDHFGNPQLDETLAKLAAAPLLTDTVNLRWELGRTTDLDVQVFDRLKTHVDTAGYFKEIERVKSEVSEMPTEHILRRDYKEFEVGPYRIGTSSVNWYFEAWTERDHGYQSITETSLKFAKQRKLDLQVIFTAFDHGQNGGYQRQLAVFVINEKLRPLQESLEESKDIGLKPLFDNYYQQENIKMSRKQIWPWIRQWIETNESK